MLAAALLPAVVRADGGAVRIKETAGDLTVTVFGAPEPLRAGPADLSVLVQRGVGGEAVLDATVTLVLTPPGEASPRELPATREAATNKLLYAAVTDLAVAGTWSLAVEVRGADGTQIRIAGSIPVAVASPRLAAIWGWLVFPPVAVAIFALHQHLGRRRRDRFAT